jgi:hypothetical protein
MLFPESSERLPRFWHPSFRAGLFHTSLERITVPGDRNKIILARNQDGSYAPLTTDAAKEHNYKSEDISIGLKKLQIYERIIRNRHLQDSIDWIEAICRPSTEPIVKLLKKAQTELVDKKIPIQLGFSSCMPCRVFTRSAFFHKRRIPNDNAN